MRRLLALGLLLASAFPASAHDARPSFLDVREAAEGRYETKWKRPAAVDLALPVRVVWPGRCVESAPVEARTADALLARGTLDCGPEGLVGARIGFDGLERLRTDVLVRVGFADGTAQTTLVKPAAPFAEVAGPRSAAELGWDYFRLGFKHILEGLDHLLFVLCLMLMVRSLGPLARTITAFTVGHSITLAGVTLGHVAPPQAPVEAAIALSIVFLAAESLRRGTGAEGLAARAPWLVALIFGLLHGFGFAGALREIGLPAADVPLALVAFNLGVEVGQLAFVTVLLPALLALGRVYGSAPPALRAAPSYAIGALAAFWFIQRAAGLVA